MPALTDQPIDRSPTPPETDVLRTGAARLETRAPLVGMLTVLASAALFGTLGPLARFAYDLGVGPAAWVAWRALIGFAALAAFIAWRARSGASGRAIIRFDRLPSRTRWALGVAAVTGFTLNLCMFYAFDRITIALALLGFYTYPAMIAIVNVVLRREVLDRPKVVALVLAMAGMTAVVASQLDPAAGIRLDALGIGLALGAALSQTIYVVVSRDGYREVPTEQAIAVVMVVTFIGASAVALLGGTAASLVPPIDSAGIIPLMLFTGIFAAAIPSLGFLSGIRRIGGLRAGILMLFEPVVGVALAAWLLGEALVPIQLAGAVAILAAAVILQRSSRDAEPAATHAAVVVGGGP